MFKNKRQFDVKNLKRDNDGRFIAIEITVGPTDITIAITCAPNQDKPSFYVEAIKQIESLNSEHKIIGDLNSCLNTELDKNGTTYNNNRSLAVLEEFMKTNFMIDIWRCNPEKCILHGIENSPRQQCLD